MARFQGKVAIVTGAGRGIGRGVAIRLAQEGAAVCVNYSRSKEAALATVEEIRSQDGQAFAYQADVKLPDQVQAMVDETASRHGRLDIVVANAGINPRHSFLEMKVEEWDASMDTNLKGTFLICQRGAREMVKVGGGKIVIMGSLAGVLNYPGMVLYSTSKGAQMVLSRALASELAIHNINVNCLAIGRTVHERQFAENPNFDPHTFDDIIPIGRAGKPTDIASAVAFLCSDEAEFITGATLAVDGGLGVMNYLWGCVKGPVRRQH